MTTPCELPWMSGTEALDHIMRVRGCDEANAFVRLQKACHQNVVAVRGLWATAQWSEARGFETQEEAGRRRFRHAVRSDECREFRKSLDENYEFRCEDVLTTWPHPAAQREAHAEKPSNSAPADAVASSVAALAPTKRRQEGHDFRAGDAPSRAKARELIEAGLDRQPTAPKAQAEQGQVVTQTEDAGDGSPPAAPFTVESVRALLHEHVFRMKGPLASLRDPSPQSLGHLTIFLRRMQNEFRRGMESKEHDDRITKFSEAIDTIEEILPHLIQQHKEHLKRVQLTSDNLDTTPSEDDIAFMETLTKPGFVRLIDRTKCDINERLTILQEAVSNISDMRKHTSLFDKSWKLRFYGTGWRDLAVRISGDLLYALASTNSNIDLGISNDGPVPRFVAAVLPMITGDSPTVANVAKVLKDRKRESKRQEFEPPF
jgi:hypothetical protein